MLHCENVVGTPMHKSARPVLVVLLMLLAGGLSGCEQSVALGPGIRAAAAPLQWPTDPSPFPHRGFVLSPQAEFTITAKLLSRRQYRWDSLADLAPWDFAVGWDLMSDETLLEWVSITQGDRFLFRQLLHPRLPLRRIEQSSANLHLIPADPATEAKLASVDLGAIITLSGLLVNARDDPRGREFLTSLSRDDVGAGACEILYVRELEVKAP